MNLPVVILYVLYLLDLLVLFSGLVYVFYCLIASKYYHNAYLNGTRLKVAFILPFLMIFYVGSDCYHSYLFNESTMWNTSDASMWDKAFRQGVSLVTSLVATLLITGYDFGNKT